MTSPSGANFGAGAPREGALENAVDAVLARAITQGDPRAPRAAWQRYAPLVRRMVRRSLGPDYDVEDVVQEVFLCLFQRIRTLREPSALRAFLVSICMLDVRYELRSRRVRRLPRLAPAAELSQLRAVPADHDARRALSRLYGILDRLSARDRAAFVSRFIEEMSDAAVASAPDVSIPTARRASAHAWQRVLLLAGKDAFLAELLPLAKESP